MSALGDILIDVRKHCNAINENYVNSSVLSVLKYKTRIDLAWMEKQKLKQYHQQKYTHTHINNRSTRKKPYWNVFHQADSICFCRMHENVLLKMCTKILSVWKFQLWQCRFTQFVVWLWIWLLSSHKYYVLVLLYSVGSFV